MMPLKQGLSHAIGWVLLGSVLALSPLGCTGGSATTSTSDVTAGDAVGTEATSPSVNPDGSPTNSDGGGTSFPDVIWEFIDADSPQDPGGEPDGEPGVEVLDDTTGQGPTDTDEDSVTSDGGTPSEDGADGEDTDSVSPDTGSPSPCDGEPCPAPAPACEGQVLLSWSAGCVVNAEGPLCVFEPAATHCHDEGLGLCHEGACAPCGSDDQCNQAMEPGPFCPNDLVMHQGSWACQADGTCAFEGVMSQCTGVTWAICEGDAVQWYANQCVDGLGCTDLGIDHEEAVDCGADGLVCVDLQFPQCADPTDTCAGDADCVQLPSDSCKSADLLQTYDAGTCFTTTDGPGICVYLPTYVVCDDTGQICGPDACVTPPWPPAPCDTSACIQWAPEEGGNGHWYEMVSHDAPLSWPDAAAEAEAMGGSLASVTTAAENIWVFLNVAPGPPSWSGTSGPWLGGFQDTAAGDYAEPDGGWAWVSGEPFDDSAWYPPDKPDDGAGGANHLQYYNAVAPSPTWGDATGAASHAFIVEYPYP